MVLLASVIAQQASMKKASFAKHAKQSAALAILTKTVQHARLMQLASSSISSIAGVTASAQTVTMQIHPINAEHVIKIARLVEAVPPVAQVANRTVTSLYSQSPNV